MNRRRFLQGLTATAAGLFVPADVAAEPERRIWPGWSPAPSSVPIYHAWTTINVAGIAVGEIHVPERRDWLEVIQDGRIFPCDILSMGGEYLLVTAVEPGRIEVVRDLFPSGHFADPDGWVGAVIL